MGSQGEQIYRMMGAYMCESMGSNAVEKTRLKMYENVREEEKEENTKNH